MTEPTPPTPDAPMRDVAALRRNIASRKRADKSFFISGALIIFVSLGILAVLFGNLLSEGWPALTQTYYTKADKSGFGRDDLGGEITRVGDGWTVQIPLATLSDIKDSDVSKGLVGKKVGIVGRLRGGAIPQIIVREIGLADQIAAADITGTLERTQTPPAKPGDEAEVVYNILPGPLAVNVDKIPAEEKSALVSGTPVAFKMDDRVKEGRFTARSVSPLITKNFFTSFPSRNPGEAGILSAWVGTLLVMLVTMLAAIPLGAAAGIYLEEYAPKNRLTSIIEINIANLAGVPSIIWGLMALGLFVYTLALGRSVLTAGLTLGLLVLPIVIIATREAIRSIPNTIREASIGLGATKWQTIRYHILPYSMPGILTGSIIAMSRAIGETAPLVTIGALTFIAFLPRSPIPPIQREISVEQQSTYDLAVAKDPSTPPPQPQLHFTGGEWLTSEFTVMPIQLFQWVSRPQLEFHQNAAATGVVLLAMTLTLNGLAIFLRFRLRRNLKW
ncbi:MAG: phosphate ABC transporter permease PstA [Burkholderiales bacterium]|nr:phosphate ABC transporter permease PstA [Phycisphaerae bacterium]